MSSKTYLRYEHTRSFGVVASHECNVVVDSSGAFALTSGVQDVLVWNLKSGELVARLPVDLGGQNPVNCREITALGISLDDKYVAAGYANGSVRIWDFKTKAFCVLLNGHRAAVTCLRFSPDNAKLASGSKDTDVIVWDIIAQTGLFRLKGHKQQVTDVWFMGKASSQLLSSSKDTLVKLWELDTQHCAHTFVGHRSPVWGVAVNSNEDRFITASSDNLVRGFARVPEEQQSKELNNGDDTTSLVKFAKEGDKVVARDVTAPWKLMSGSVPRQSSERALTVQFSRDGTLVGISTAGKTLEVYRVRSEQDIKKKIKRRLKRSREKSKKNMEVDTEEPQSLNEAEASQLGDELQLVAALRTDHRMRSFSFGRVTSSKAQVVISFNTNSIELYTLKLNEEESAEVSEEGKKRKRDVQLTRTRALELQGHRNDIRALAISSDNTLILSAASGAAKLWNVNNRQCIRTFPAGYSLCCAFVPGDVHAIIGTKSGHLVLYNLASGEVLSDIEAHEDAIWSIDIRPDGKGFVTGSADKQVKFWEFDLAGSTHEEDEESSSDEEGSSSDEEGSSSEDEGQEKKASSDDEKSADSTSVSSSDGEGDDQPVKKQKMEPQSTSSSGSLQIVHTRTLKMSEGVMCVKYSNHKGSTRLMLAVSLLDCTVKVFHEDSLKFALSLYGHKLPVLSMDISSDNTLIATASADKNVKVWGLDFGDCHKSFFAHDASVMCVRFVPRTHYMFTAGKDGRIRYWDADKFEMILTLEAHVGEVWGLAIASDGAFLVSSGHDKSLRVWERTSDIVFIDEEREKELEKNFDSKLVNDNTDPSKTGTLAVEAVKAITDTTVEPESGVATKRTTETLVAGERLMEALDLADSARERLEEYEKELAREMAMLDDEEREAVNKGKKKAPVGKPQLPLEMLGREPVAYIVYILRGIKAAELNDALLVQPFSYATRLFYYISQLLENGSQANIELASKVGIGLLRVHFKQIVATQAMKKTLIQMRETMRGGLCELQDLIGTNMAAMRTLKGQLAENSTTFA
uniref:Small-subunit processome Utp12 domain-containing protein n=1 Tax=Mucochytrium quahogii TaxID=96639 RepID=A0A7S2WFX4_9STRA|mmetsp:Transcript_10989/g.20333  ORF Transcript_10989/g.20333 Transcript_10989/m.20333 type:complete len:1030 (-) Transcript_10989:1053-4142(-)|eukprot:CAMPEP_0203759534 /NCGR_PEP_ID=MMETSP0098-20131031/12571_1 /ASSEMBLY_ACC=CAM_ASM_000208 /TAXON_ID=96639 /ORGANISM=" , Strain NY0313808BC1" /LENGTH=1029 /DNA_ID=CAMNT_0050652543 /DNA_START=108 /DNA_END=3197 /DNA_ORIENTATION=-